MIGVGEQDLPDHADHLQMLQAKQSITNNVIMQRKDQMNRWQSSEMNRASSARRTTEVSKVKFCEGDIFLSACMSGDEDEVEELLDHGTDINTCTIDGVTALHQAVIDDKYDIVRFLVEHGADINIQDNEGWTPLHAAVCCANVEILEYLCVKGADLTIVNSDRELPIDLAKDEECKQLLEKEYARQRITYDECRDHELRIMQRDCADWVARGVFEDRPHHRTGATALHVAASKNYMQIIVPLIKAGANVHARDIDGWTPLHAAAHWGHVEACRLLLENGASFDETNYAGDAVLRVADKMILNELEDLEDEWKNNMKIPSQVLQNNNSLLGSRKSSRSDDKLHITTVRSSFEQNENSASTSHECSPPPAKKQETDSKRSFTTQNSNDNYYDNTHMTTSAHVELSKKTGDISVESEPIRLLNRRSVNDDDESDLSKETSVSSEESKSSTISSEEDSGRNLVSTSDDVSKSCSELSQVSSSDFTTRLPLLESSSENAVVRPTKLGDPLKRNYMFPSHDSPPREASTSSSERSSSCISREASSATKESSTSPNVEFTVRMKGNRAGWLQDGKRADFKKTVGAIVAPSIRSSSSNTSSSSPLNSPSPIQSPMQRKTFPPVVSNVHRCSSSPSSVPWAARLRSSGSVNSAVKSVPPLDEPPKNSSEIVASDRKGDSSETENGRVCNSPASRNFVPSPAYVAYSAKLRSWQTPPMQPSQKDEREAERKAKSRMQRATRRSTQAVTSEDVNSARAWKSSTLSQEVDSDKEMVKDGDTEEKSSCSSVTEESSSSSSVTGDSTNNNHTMSALSPGVAPSPSHTPSASHLRRRSHVNRGNRRGTGPVSLEDLQAASCSMNGEDNSGVPTVSVSLVANHNAPESDTTRTDITNYKALYENEQKANERLKKEMEQLEKKLIEREQKINALQLTRASFTQNSLDEKDKRFYERKIEELENKTKDYDQMRNDNKRLKEENGALIRVISKLSK
uniref:ANK_REP_REGION domain-containing protein n=1 Tax=Steinernema glaseri TaxID=37863 RepID=A0A1I8ATV8_9BILA